MTGMSKSIVILLMVILLAGGSLATLGSSIENLKEEDQTLDELSTSKLAIVASTRIKRRSNINKLSAATTGKQPEFGASIGNVSAVLGRDVRLVCTVENLGQHQVAWLKEETKTILSIDTNIIITNYRIFLIPDEEGRKWVLHIKDVQESDRGFYQCQVNTNPMRSTSGYLDVVMPPTIIESESTQVAEVVEHSNVTIQCKANGHPRPTISWRREDGEPIRLRGGGGGGDSPDDLSSLSKIQRRADDKNVVPTGRHGQKKAIVDQQTITHLNDVRSDRLTFTHVDRSMAGLYVCMASNGIPSQTSRQIPLYVKFPPRVSTPQKAISVNLGEQLEIDCLIEAFPKPTSYWSERQLSRSAAVALNRPTSSGQTRFGGGSASSSPRWHHMRVVDRQGGATFGERLLSPTRRQVERNEQPLEEQANDDLNEPDQLDDASLQDGALMTNRTREPAGSQAFVTVKQTALNSYTYKLRISNAKMRPSDFGEYVCIATNSMGTSSAKVLVKKGERNQIPAAAAVESSLNRPSSLTESVDNQVDYQRDSLSDAMTWSSGHQYIQATPKSLQSQRQLSDTRRLSSSLTKQSNRIYDENYLQSIRNRQSSHGHVNPSSAIGGERSSAKSGSDRACWLSIASAVCWYIILRRANTATRQSTRSLVDITHAE